MQPPRLTAIARGKLSNRSCFKFRRVQTKHHSHEAIPFSRRNVPALGFAFLLMSVDRCPSLRHEACARHHLRVRSFDKDLSLSVSLRIPNRQSLGRLANALTAADMRVHPVSKAALVSRSWALRAI